MSGETPRARADRLWDEHASDLLAFLVYRTGDVGLAEDVVADAFERVLATKHRWRGRDASERTWLYSIALNRLRDLHRRRGAEERALEQLPQNGRPDDLEELGERDLIRRGLQTLPAEERDVLALRFGGDLGLQEIADLLAVPRSTVEGRLYRGLRRMRDVV